MDDPELQEEMESRKEIRRRDYVLVVETNDEWDGLVGVIDDFLDENGQSCLLSGPNVSCLVRIPVTRRTQRQLRMIGVNHLTDYVLRELRLHDELRLFPLAHLEWISADEL